MHREPSEVCASCREVLDTMDGHRYKPSGSDQICTCGKHRLWHPGQQQGWHGAAVDAVEADG